MTELAHTQDPRELVGYPRTPLRKLSRTDRLTLKKFLKDISRDIDPTIGLRIALSSGSPIRPEWLQSRQIDLALETDDILKNLDKLTSVTKLLRATQVAEVLSKRVEHSPAVILRAICKLAMPKAGPGGSPVRPTLDLDTTLWIINLATALVPLLLKGPLVKAKKLMPGTLLEIVYRATQSYPLSDVAIRALDFLRTLEKHVGWAELENEPVQTMRNSLQRLPATIIRELLEQGALAEATVLSERVSASEPADHLFKAAVTDALAAANQLPLTSKNWAMRLLHPADVEESPSLIASDASFERLALVLINAWEAREEGKNAAHAFEVSQEVFRNGFNIYMGGEVGSFVVFDPDIHETNAHLNRGTAGRLTRPWVELRGTSDVRILIKGRVLAAT